MNSFSIDYYSLFFEWLFYNNYSSLLFWYDKITLIIQSSKDYDISILLMIYFKG